jgi:UV DNA damage endonuclease
MTGKIGFACKYMHHDQTVKKKLLEEIQRPLNTRATTVAWLDNQPRDVAVERIHDIVDHNTKSVERLVEYVGSLDKNYRMVRLGSDVLPMYTHPKWKFVYADNELQNLIQSRLQKVGEIARASGTRLSMHPGQFTVLASDKESVVDNSIEEFEYHVDLARWMGYGKEFQDFKINVHISGKQGPQGIKNVLSRLSPEARNTITIENDEMSWGIDASLELANDLALVLDIHHHWVNSGEYIRPTDDRYKRIIDSWRGVRPVIHYSVSREDLLVNHDPDILPDLEALLAQGYKKAKLRAHSDMMWNRACNRWAASFLDTADIMVESKFKNLASLTLLENQ